LSEVVRAKYTALKSFDNQCTSIATPNGKRVQKIGGVEVVMSDAFRRAASKYLTGDQLQRANHEAREEQNRSEAYEHQQNEEFHRYWESVHPQDDSECTDHS